MDFSNTTSKDGIIQGIERDTGLGDTAVSGDTTLLKQFTAEVNDAYDELYPYLYRYIRKIGWDDTNNNGEPVTTQDIASGVNVYTFEQDANSLDILALFDITVLTSASATQYTTLHKITADDERAPFFISPNSDSTGIPSEVLIVGNKIYFDVTPDYSVTDGIKAFYSRDRYRFVSSDTTKQAGFPIPFHPLLHLIPSVKWMSINKPTEVAAMTILNGKIAAGKLFLENIIGGQTPTKSGFRSSPQNNH